MTGPAVAIRSALTSAQAEAVIRPVAGEWQPWAEKKLYYPYFWFQIRCTASTPLGRSSVRVSCLVDTRTRLGSTADPFELEPIVPETGELVKPRLTRTEALEIAHRYVAYVAGARRKALVVPELQTLNEDLVHKPFWIVKCSKPGEAAFRVLVDAVTGGFYVLGPTDVAQPA